MNQQGSAFNSLNWNNTVMVPAGTLLPGDVLDGGGELVLGWTDTGKPYEKLKVLTGEGNVELRSYGQHFNLLRMRRPGER